MRGNNEDLEGVRTEEQDDEIEEDLERGDDAMEDLDVEIKFIESIRAEEERKSDLKQ